MIWNIGVVAYLCCCQYRLFSAFLSHSVVIYTHLTAYLNIDIKDAEY